MKRTEKAEKNNRDWFRGQLFAEDSLDPEFEVSPAISSAAMSSAHGTLADPQRALIILAALAASQTLNAIPRYTLAALDIGAKAEEIKEALYHCTPYIGLEKVRSALEEVNEAFQKAGITYPLAGQSTVTEDTRFEKGLAVQQTIGGEDNIRAMREAAHQDLKHIQDYLSAYCFGVFIPEGRWI